MSTQEIFIQHFERLFHRYQQALNSGNLEGEPGSCSNWGTIPSGDRDRILAAARLAIMEMQAILPGENSRKYYARPGEAEWGC